MGSEQANSDELLALLEGCRKQRLKSQEQLYKMFYGYAYSICHQYAYSRDETVEIMNDAFLKVFQGLDKYDESRSFKSWLRRILVNTSIDYYRRSLKHRAVMDLEDTQEECQDANALDQLGYEELLQTLNQLPDTYRITFMLFEIEGYSHQEIAEKLSTTVSTSRSNLTRAKKMLRKLVARLMAESTEKDGLRQGII